MNVTWRGAGSVFRASTSGKLRGVWHNSAWMAMNVDLEEWRAVRDAPSLSAWTAAIERLRMHAQAEGRRFSTQHPAEPAGGDAHAAAGGTTGGGGLL